MPRDLLKRQKIARRARSYRGIRAFGEHFYARRRICHCRCSAPFAGFPGIAGHPRHGDYHRYFENRTHGRAQCGQRPFLLGVDRRRAAVDGGRLVLCRDGHGVSAPRRRLPFFASGLWRARGDAVCLVALFGDAHRLDRAFSLYVCRLRQRGFAAWALWFRAVCRRGDHRPGAVEFARP